MIVDARDAAAPDARGWGRYARELFAALERTRPDGIEIVRLEAGGAGPEVLWEQISLPRILRRRSADLVHSPNCFLPLRRPCPGVVTVHDLAFEAHPEDFSRRTGLKYRALARRAAHSAERVIVPSQFTRDDLARRWKIDPQKVRVIAEAPALPITDAEPPPGPYLLAVGDLRLKKNLARLVEAFRALHEDGLPHRLVLAGADQGQAASLLATAGNAPVELTGYVDDSRLDALMRGADALVHPSLYEGFGLVIAEAMARGVPVACAAAGALPETAGGAALLFDPHDVAGMAASIIAITGDRSRRTDLAERGLARAAELSWDAAAERTAHVYRELL